MQDKIKVLFICHGNICRSTMAQSVFAHLAAEANMADNFEIDSAARRNRKYTTLRNSKETQGRERSTHPAQGASDDKKRLFIL